MNAKIQTYNSFSIRLFTGYTARVRNYTKWDIMTQTGACTVHRAQLTLIDMQSGTTSQTLLAPSHRSVIPQAGLPHPSIPQHLHPRQLLNIAVTQHFFQYSPHSPQDDHSVKLEIKKQHHHRTMAKPSDNVEDGNVMSIIKDSDLNFKSHSKTFTKSAYYHLKSISRIKGPMSPQDLEKLLHAFIFSRFDLCNSVFTGLLKKSRKSPSDNRSLSRMLLLEFLTKTKKLWYERE